MPKAKKHVSRKHVSAKTTKVAKHTYTSQRDAFFKKHPNARWLLGLLVIAFCIFLAQYYRNFAIQADAYKYLTQ
jgi:hypothetical protein